MDPLTDLLSGRRFSAIGIRHHELTSVSEFRSVLSRQMGTDYPIDAGDDGIRLYGVEFLDSVERYSKVSARIDGNDFGHDGYLAFTRVGAVSTAWVLSPFRRLLGKTVARLVRDVIGEAEAFVRPVLTTAIAHVKGEGVRIRVAEREQTCKVSQVTVRVQGDVGVQLVALSGQAPLQSTMLKTIEDKRVVVNGKRKRLATPYALRFEVPSATGRRVKFNLDRHGNFFWYQAEPDEVVPVMQFLLELEKISVLEPSFRVPLEGRKHDEADGDA